MVIAPAIAISVSTFTILSNGRLPKRNQSVCIRGQSEFSGCFSLADTLSTRQTTSITTSPKGQFLASSYGQLIQLWDLSTGKPLTILTGHSDWVSAITFSPDGQMLASSSLDKTIRIWNSRTGQLLHLFAAGRMTTLAFSPDGTMLAAGSRNRFWLDGQLGSSGVQIWGLKTGKQLRLLGSGQVAALAFSPNGQIATGSSDTQLWNLKTGELLHTLNSGEVTSLTFKPDGQTLVSGSSKIKVWHVDTGKLIHTFNSGASDLAVSPDGSTLAVANGGTIQVLQMATGKLLATFRGSWYSNLWVNFGLNGRLLVSGSSDGIKVWRSH